MLVSKSVQKIQIVYTLGMENMIPTQQKQDQIVFYTIKKSMVKSILLQSTLIMNSNAILTQVSVKLLKLFLFSIQSNNPQSDRVDTVTQ